MKKSLIALFTIISLYACESDDNNTTNSITQNDVEIAETKADECSKHESIATLSIANYNPDFKYKWSTGETNQSITVDYPGLYFLHGTDTNGNTRTQQYEVANCENICDINYWSLGVINHSGYSFSCYDPEHIFEGYFSGHDSTTYRWIHEGMIISNDKIIKVKAEDMGLYYIEAYTKQGCYARDSITIDDVQMDTIPPTVSISASKSSLNCSDSTNLIINYTTNSIQEAATNYFTYKWSNGDSGTATSSTSKKPFKVSTPGTYTVTVFDSQKTGCSSTKEITITSTCIYDYD